MRYVVCRFAREHPPVGKWLRRKWWHTYRSRFYKAYQLRMRLHGLWAHLYQWEPRRNWVDIGMRSWGRRADQK
jgi:hypothetical protein